MVALKSPYVMPIMSQLAGAVYGECPLHDICFWRTPGTPAHIRDESAHLRAIGSTEGEDERNLPICGLSNPGLEGDGHRKPVAV